MKTQKEKPRTGAASGNGAREKGTAVRVGSGDWFDKCVRRTHRSTGMLLIECRLGLWAVEGPDHAFVEQNARHYWMQYHADGEYAKILANSRGQPAGETGSRKDT